MAIAKGWGVVKEYEDAGISGTKDAQERPALARLLKDAAGGGFDAVIVLALDRLGRRTRLVLELVEELAARKVVLVSCKESLDTSTPHGQFVLTIFAALTQLERDTIVERTTAGRNERGKRDGERGGKVPYGYRRVFDADTGEAIGVEIIPEQAEIVRDIFRLRGRKLPLREIASLMQGRIASPEGAKWSHVAVKRILDNEAKYRGGYRGESRMRWPLILEHVILEPVPTPMHEQDLVEELVQVPVEEAVEYR